MCFFYFALNGLEGKNVLLVSDLESNKTCEIQK